MTVCFRCLVCCGDRVAASCGLGQTPSEQVHSHVDTGNCTCEYCDSVCDVERERRAIEYCDVGRECGEQVITGTAFVT